MKDSTDIGVNNGTSGHTPNSTSKDSYHSICNTVSFSEEDMITDTVAAKAREFAPPSVANLPA